MDLIREPGGDRTLKVRGVCGNRKPRSEVKDVSKRAQGISRGFGPWEGAGRHGSGQELEGMEA
jgi:hypothetical protein